MKFIANVPYFPSNGYTAQRPTTDISLGLVDGVDNSLWAYVYASILFSGTLSAQIRCQRE
jgi:hypothetical protein